MSKLTNLPRNSVDIARAVGEILDQCTQDNGQGWKVAGSSTANGNIAVHIMLNE